MINDCAMLSFAMATLMMTFCTLAFCKIGRKSCADGALLSLVGIGVGVVALTCIFPNFQHMIQHLPGVQNIIANNGIIALIADSLALAATASVATMALGGALKMKKNNFSTLYKCFLMGIIVAGGIAYFINSECIVHDSHEKEHRHNN